MKKLILLVLFVFGMFVTSSCEGNDINTELGYEPTATDKGEIDAPGTGGDDDDDVY